MSKKSEKLLFKVIREKKEVYYPIITIILSYLFYWICILFVSIANSQIVLPFLLLSIVVLLFVHSFDKINELKEINESNSRKLVFVIILVSVIISFTAILRIIILTIIDLYQIIPISIHILSSILIYIILRREVKKYYIRKNTKNIE